MSQWCGDRGSDEQLSVGFEQIGGLLCFRQSEDDIVSPIAAVEGGAWIQEAEMSKGVNACDAFVGGCPEVAFVIEGDLSLTASERKLWVATVKSWWVKCPLVTFTNRRP